MCGISGILAFDGAPVTPQELARMSRIMTHRGPDGGDEWVSADGRVGLAHRRLSIIDLSMAANQPMPNEDASLQVIFNGEIYNHTEIRTELSQSGRHRWRTHHSDTEVILHGYEDWGIDVVHRLRGMFALALWDARSRRLWLIRDRIGVKPLYYTVADGRFLFASEIKALLTVPGVRRRVNHEALYHYLSFLTAPAPHTLFEGIYKLPSATRLSVDADGRMLEERYWDVWDHTRPLVGVSDRQIAELLLAELRTAVEYRKVSDVPVGVFLSGGIDSSANTALFADNVGAVKTFSIGYDGEYSSCRDELPYAERMARFTGAEHYVRRLRPEDLLAFLSSMVYHQDEPIGDVVCVPLYYVARLAREHDVIVCQVGEGADELFCGYPSWMQYLRVSALNRLPVPNVARRAGLGLLAAVGHKEGFAYECLRRAATGEPIFWGGAEGLTHQEKQRVLGPALRRQFCGYSSVGALSAIRRRFQDNAWDTSELNWMSYLDLNLRLPELLLMRVDKMTMATSLEARVPFLDHKLVEFAMSVPSRAKIRGGEPKRLLKMAVRGLIPDDIIERKKQGFGVPLQEWMFDRLAVPIRAELEAFCGRTELLDRAEVLRMIEAGNPSKVWQLLNLALWHARFIEAPPQSERTPLSAAIVSAAN